MTRSATDIHAPSGLGRFWAWWTTELRLAFGIRFRPPKPPRRRVRLVEGEAILTDASGRELSRKVLLPDTGSKIAPGRKLALILPEDQVILRKRDLPRRAEAELARVVDLQFDAHIPLRRDQCYAAHQITGRRGDMLEVQIAAAPRDRVDSARRQLSDIGLSPGWVGPADPPLNLLTDGRPPARRVQAVGAAVLGILSVAVIAAAVWIPVLRLQDHNTALAIRAETAMAQANAAMRAQQEVQAELDRIATLDGFAAPVGLLTRIDALAGGIGDDTYLVSLSFDGEQLVLGAQTPDPAQLMQNIAMLDGLGTPELTSPVSPQQDGRARVTLAIPLDAAP